MNCLTRLKVSFIGSVALTAALVSSAGAQAEKPRDVYPAPEAAAAQIKAALAKAAREHKRVILDFGGNWCGDCRVLAKYFHEAPNAELLKKHFVLVGVNIGNADRNLDIAKRYGVPLDKGVPALAVLDAKGHPLFSQKNGEFESMRRMEPSAVTQFLNRWKQ